MWKAVATPPAAWCRECNWPIDPGARRVLCLVCEAMLASVQSEFFRRAHAEYVEEESRWREHIRRLKRNL